MQFCPCFPKTFWLPSRGSFWWQPSQSWVTSHPPSQPEGDLFMFILKCITMKCGGNLCPWLNFFWNNTWHVRLVRGNFCDTFPSPAVGVLLVRNNSFQLRFLSSVHLQTKNKSIGSKRRPCALHTWNVWRILSQINLIHGKLNVSLFGWLMMARPPPAAPSKRLHLLNLSFKKIPFSSKDIFEELFSVSLPKTFFEVFAPTTKLGTQLAAHVSLSDPHTPS